MQLTGKTLQIRFLLGLLLLLLSLVLLPLAHAQDDFLPPDQAFRFSAHQLDPQTVAVDYAIAPGYYMYRDHFKFSVDHGKLGDIDLPKGAMKYDENFDKTLEIYRGHLSFNIPVEDASAYTLTVVSQGCADKGLCYPPEAHRFANMASVAALTGASKAAAAESTSLRAAPPDVLPATADNPGRIERLLHSGQWLFIIPSFLILGLGLSLTPCVLPMLPILSSLIVGQGGAVGARRGFLLSVFYALGMALIYTALGVAAGLLGEGFAAYLQNPWVLSVFGFLMAALALSVFDVYSLQMPGFIQDRLTARSNRQQGGRFLGVFVMGALSALIVGPCVAAPLAGTLLYISQTRDALIGAVALFSLAAGMSVPLLVVGASAGRLLPRAGGWMDEIKRFFGVLMLAVALWLVGPVMPAAAQLGLWGLLLVGYGMYLFSRKLSWRMNVLALALVVAGVVQWVGMASGARDPFDPLAHFKGSGAAEVAVPFERVQSVAQLDAMLAADEGKPVMLDFYADWCVSCKEMERFTFSNAAVRQELTGFRLLQVDVTANNEADRALLKRFGLYGPPGIVFFDRKGQEIPSVRVVGYEDATRFGATLDKVRQAAGKKDYR